MSIMLRAANTIDIKPLSTFASKCFSENFGHLYEPQYLAQHLIDTCSEAFFTHELQSGSHITLALLEGTIVGYTKFGKVGLPIETKANDREIHRLYVDSSTQARGIGKKLIKSALSELQQLEARSIYLGVWEENHRAQQLYRSFGFKPVGSYLYPVGPHRDKEIIMRLDAPFIAGKTI